jgi:hypothetical protein
MKEMAISFSFFFSFFFWRRWGHKNLLVYVTICSMVGSISVIGVKVRSSTPLLIKIGPFLTISLFPLSHGRAWQLQSSSPLPATTSSSRAQHGALLFWLLFPSSRR